MSVFTPVWAVGKWQQDVCCELNGGGGDATLCGWVRVCVRLLSASECFICVA